MPTTTQQSFSPIHPTITTPQNKNTAFPRTTIQSTVKPSLASNYSKMDYQTFRPITKWRQKKQTKQKKEKVFSDHNYKFFAKNNITKPPCKSNQSQSQAHNYDQKYNNKFPTQFFSTINNELHWIIAKVSRFFFSIKIETNE